MNLISYIKSIFTKQYTLLWGTQDYDSHIDKISYQQEKNITFLLKEKHDNVIYYAFPTEFGYLCRIWRFPPAGSLAPVKDVITEWKLGKIIVNKVPYYVYNFTIKSEEAGKISYGFSFSK